MNKYDITESLENVYKAYNLPENAAFKRAGGVVVPESFFNEITDWVRTNGLGQEGFSAVKELVERELKQARELAKKADLSPETYAAEVKLYISLLESLGLHGTATIETSIAVSRLREMDVDPYDFM